MKKVGRVTGRASFKGLKFVLKGLLAVAAAAGAVLLKVAIVVVKRLIAAVEKALKAGLKALRELIARNRRARELEKAAERVRSGRRTKSLRRRRSPLSDTTAAERLKEARARAAALEAARASKITDRSATAGTKTVPRPPAGRSIPAPRRAHTRGASPMPEPVVTTYFNDAKEALEQAFHLMQTEFTEMFDETRFDRDWRHVEASGREMVGLLEEFAARMRGHGALFEDKPAIAGAFGETVTELGSHLDSTAEAMEGAINIVRSLHADEVAHVEERRAGRQVFNTARD